jgi:hypothetical protein
MCRGSGEVELSICRVAHTITDQSVTLRPVFALPIALRGRVALEKRC